MPKTFYARVNGHKELALLPDLGKDFGIMPGDEIHIEPSGHGLHYSALWRVSST